jgi:hypothetical protein
MAAGNMSRIEINIHETNCTSSWLFTKNMIHINFTIQKVTRTPKNAVLPLELKVLLVIVTLQVTDSGC